MYSSNLQLNFECYQNPEIVKTSPFRLLKFIGQYRIPHIYNLLISSECGSYSCCNIGNIYFEFKFQHAKCPNDRVL